jgi:hypothetical protein
LILCEFDSTDGDWRAPAQAFFHQLFSAAGTEKAGTRLLREARGDFGIVCHLTCLELAGVAAAERMPLSLSLC